MIAINNHIEKTFEDLDKEAEANLISTLAHYHYEIPLALNKGISPLELTEDDKANCKILMYQRMKQENRLKYFH